MVAFPRNRLCLLIFQFFSSSPTFSTLFPFLNSTVDVSTASHILGKTAFLNCSNVPCALLASPHLCAHLLRKLTTTKTSCNLPASWHERKGVRGRTRWVFQSFLGFSAFRRIFSLRRHLIQRVGSLAPQKNALLWHLSSTWLEALWPHASGMLFSRKNCEYSRLFALSKRNVWPNWESGRR